MNGVRLKLNQALLFLLVGALILFGTHSAIFAIIAFVLCTCAMLVMDQCDFSLMLFFIMPLTSIFKLSADSTSLYTYIELLFVAYHYLKKGLKMEVRDVLALIFLAYIVITEVYAGKFELTRTIKMALNLWLVSVFLCEDWQNRYDEFFICFALGVIISSAMRFLDSSFFNISAFVSQVEQGFSDGSSVTRFSGLYGDPNYFAVNAIISLCLLGFLYQKGKLRLLFTLILFAPLVYFCAITGSKSALLMLTFPMLMLLHGVRKNRRYFVYAVLLLLLVFGIYMVFSGRISIFATTLARLSNANEGLDKLTTGRSTLWMNYIKELKSHPLQIIFGNSPSVYLLNGRGVHNTYIDFIFQLGAVGTVLYFYILRPIERLKHPGFKRQITNYSVFITMLVMYFFLSMLQFFDMPFHMTLGFICMNISPMAEGKAYCRRMKSRINSLGGTRI